MSDLIDKLRIVGGVGNEAADLIEQQQYRISELEQREEELQVTVEGLREGVETALYGSLMDEFRTRNEDGLLHGYETESAIKVLQEVYTRT